MSLAQYVSWSEIDFLIEAISKNVSKSNRVFSSITTISRGGLVPSRLLADHLAIDEIRVDEKTISADSLFVDDIFDSGKTFDKIISKTIDPLKLCYVTLYARRGKKYPAQLIYGTETRDDDAYVVFPWDKVEFEISKK